jgi:hypothetical protein
MSQLKIGLRDNKTCYEPGQELVGAMGWELTAPLQAVEIRLIWFTRGRAIADVEVVQCTRLDHPKVTDARPFMFRLPEMPHSFQGALASLVWAVELVALPSREYARAEFAMAPGGKEIRLGGSA